MNIRDNIWKIAFTVLFIVPPLILGLQVINSFFANGVLPTVYDRTIGHTIDTTIQVGLFIMMPTGLIWMIVSAFRVSKSWGLSLLLSVGIAQLAFIPLHWDKAKRPFALQLIGIAYFIGGMSFVPIHT